jgi:hypothetical protein
MGQMKIVATGTLGALNNAVTAEFRHLSNGAAGVQITGTFSATALIEASSTAAMRPPAGGAPSERCRDTRAAADVAAAATSDSE